MRCIATHNICCACVLYLMYSNHLFTCCDVYLCTLECHLEDDHGHDIQIVYNGFYFRHQGSDIIFLQMLRTVFVQLNWLAGLLGFSDIRGLHTCNLNAFTLIRFAFRS